MIFRGFLIKIFETIQGFLTFLYFIKDHQRPARYYRNIGIQRQSPNKPVRIFRILENRLQFRSPVEIELYIMVKTFLSECFHRPRLSCLPGSAQKDRFPVRRILPFFQRLDYFPLEFHNLHY